MISPSSFAFLKRLLDAPAPSGFETAAARAWRSEAEQFAHKVSVDVTGNSMAEVNPGGHPTIMLDGHIDEIGVIVQYIDDDGFIYIAPIGGWGPHVGLWQRACLFAEQGGVVWVGRQKTGHPIKKAENAHHRKLGGLWGGSRDP